MATTSAPSFTTIKIRTAALIINGEDIALIRRERPAGPHYTLPGGNVEPGEDLHTALRRELAEELRLTLDDTAEPELCWVQDQMLTRPGPTIPPRKLHLIFRHTISDTDRAALATHEHDTRPDGTTDTGTIEWVNWRKLSDLTIFPAIGTAAASLHTPNAAPHDTLLDAMTDRNYTWR
jgi:8-oxo-dGTP diphosphatase